MSDPVRVDDGLWEWANVTPDSRCGWIHAEKVARGIVQMTGEGQVVIMGSLFADGYGGEVLRLSVSDQIAPLPFIPHRIRPVVLDGAVTVRVYIPRG